MRLDASWFRIVFVSIVDSSIDLYTHHQTLYDIKRSFVIVIDFSCVVYYMRPADDKITVYERRHVVSNQFN